MLKKRLKIANGYSVYTKEKQYDYETAVEILGKIENNDIASAEIRKDCVILKKFVWQCPFCNHENQILNYDEIQFSKIYDSLFYQTSLFDDEDKVIEFILENDDDEIIHNCSKCGQICSSLSKTHEIEILYDEKQNLKIRLKLDNIYDLLQVDWLSGDISNIIQQFPLFETINFDFSIGKVALSLENDNEDVLLSNKFYDEYKSLITLFISKSMEIKKTIQDILIQIWEPNNFPFNESQISFERLLALVKFVGYPDKRFYDSIPFNINDNHIFPSFKGISEKLHYYARVPELYTYTQLPNFKSLKKLIFSELQLLFYFGEIEKLWDTFHDENLLVRLLKSENRYEILAYLHLYPNMFDFFQDFIKFKPKTTLVIKILDSFYPIFFYAINYSSMRLEAKKHENDIWKSTVNYDWLSKFKQYERPFNIPFSIPFRTLNSDFEMEFGGFQFTPLSNKKEYVQAGRKLNNCLIEWISTNNPVILVTHKGKAKAAIEIEDNKAVVQALAKNNESLYLHPKLSTVCTKYLDSNKIEYDDAIL